MKNHKNVYKLQLKDKLEYYRFFRLSPHENRSLVFYRLNVLEVRWQAGQVGYNEGRPNPLSSTKNAFTEI